MRFHPLAVSVVVGALASSSFPSSTVVDAFVVPKSLSQTTAQWYQIKSKSKTTARFVGDGGFGESPYVSLDLSLEDDEDTPKSSSSKATTKQRKPNVRVENRRAQLEADLAAAEESKIRTAQQLSEAEEFRSSLAAKEEKAIREAEALDAKLKAFEVKQAKAAKSPGGSLFGVIGEIAGTFTAVVAARAAMTERSQKIEEERLRKEEEQRIAEEAAKKKARQQKSNENVLPIVVGTVGLGAFGAFFGGGIGGYGGGETIVNSMSKNALRNAVGNQQAMINQQQSVGTDNSPTVEMPYLEKQIAKAETKSKQKRISTRPKSRRALEREAAEEQKTVEARLEARLADAPNREAAEIEEKAAAKSATAEEIKIEVERKALLEKQEVERKVAEEKLAVEQKALEEKQRIAAEEKAKADKLSTENRIKTENEARIKSEKEAKEKEEAQIKAEKLAAAKRDAVALELLKQQNDESNGFFPKVSAVSEMLFGDKKPSQVTDKGLSNVFNGVPIVVGGVALAGIAVAAAIVAANESPSVSSTFKVTGKTPKDYMESPDAAPAPAPAPRGTVRIPQPGETVASSLPSQSKNTLRDELSKQRANINQQAAEKSSTVSSPSPDSANSFAPPPTKKSFSPYGSMKPRAASNDPLSASMTPTVTASSPAFTETDVSSSSWSPSTSPSTSDTAAAGASYLERMGSGGQADVSAPAKKSFSPFGGKKPMSVINDSLSSNTASQDLMGGGGNINNPVVQSPPVSPQPSILEPDSSGPVSLLLNGSYMDTIGAGSSSAAPKRSFSPYGSSKPVAANSDSLYSAPASQISETQVPMPTMATESTYMSSNGLDTSDIGGVGPIASTPGKSYSPFQGSKPVAATNDSLYSAPSVQSIENESNNYDIPEIESSYRAPDSSSFAPNVSPPRKSYSPFGGAKPVAAGSDSLYSAPGVGTEESSTSTMPFAASGLDDTSTVFPETTAFRATAPVKKSFSPFGSKPAAPKANNSGGGYLDEL